MSQGCFTHSPTDGHRLHISTPMFIETLLSVAKTCRIISQGYIVRSLIKRKAILKDVLYLFSLKLWLYKFVVKYNFLSFHLILGIDKEVRQSTNKKAKTSLPVLGPWDRVIALAVYFLNTIWRLHSDVCHVSDNVKISTAESGFFTMCMLFAFVNPLAYFSKSTFLVFLIYILASWHNISAYYDSSMLNELCMKLIFQCLVTASSIPLFKINKRQYRFPLSSKYYYLLHIWHYMTFTT